MTDKIVVSRAALEKARSHCPSRELEDYLRWIRDTAEPVESAWITDRAPTVDEVGDDEYRLVSYDGSRALMRGEKIREDRNTAWWSAPLPAPFNPPVKRLCWCGAEMKTVERSPGLWVVMCSRGGTYHGVGPVGPTREFAETDYDKMVGR